MYSRVYAEYFVGAVSGSQSCVQGEQTRQNLKPTPLICLLWCGQKINYTMNTNMNENVKEPCGNMMTIRYQGNASSKNEMCGCNLIGYPRWLQRFASIKVFIPVISLQMIFIAFYASIFQGSLTTIETRYQLSISQFGILTAMFTAGSLVSTVFVTHFGGRPTSRRTVWLATGGLILSLGIFLHTLPQFIFSPYQPLFSADLPPSSSELSTSGVPTGLCASGAGNVKEEERNATFCEEDNRQNLFENKLTFIIFIIAEILVGMGYGPLLPVALCYVDDSSSAGTTALASGIFDSVYGIGSVIGFPIAGGILTLWVDFNRVDVSKINLIPHDDNWVGAWWLGFLVIAIAYFLLSFSLFLFPNRMPTTHGKDLEEMGHMNEVDESDGKNGTEEEIKPSALTDLKEWPRSLLRLLKNPIFCLACLSFITESAIFYSAFKFFPKYMQDQFGIDVFTAGNITGFALVPAGAGGALVGGILVKKMDLKVPGLARLGWVVGITSCVFLVALMLVGCTNPPIAGVSVGYQGHDLQAVSLDAPCNSDCLCQPEAVFTPYCGSDGIIYFSPCHAGCTAVTENETYAGCSCMNVPLSLWSSSSTPPTLTPGHCESNCSNLVVFVVLCVMWALTMSIPSSPRNIIIISCVDPADKTFALGLSRVIMLLLGSLPFSVLYGTCIDSACLVWQTLCGERGYCDVYDIEKFRLTLFGLSFGLLAVQTLAFFLLWLVSRQMIRSAPNRSQ